MKPFKYGVVLQPVSAFSGLPIHATDSRLKGLFSFGRTNRVRCEPVSAAVENRPAMYPQNADLNLVKVSKQVAG